MKPRRIQKLNERSRTGKDVDIDDKKPLSQVRPKLRVSGAVQVRPFAGKVFYLDLRSNRISETLESDIKELGGTIEKFFSKEIKYLVTSKREARYAQCLRQDFPVPSPESGCSSPHPLSNSHQPGSHGDVIKNSHQAQTDTMVSCRGKSLVERVVKGQERLQMNKILSKALDWGVKILYINDVREYVRKKKKAITTQCMVTTAVKPNVKTDSTVKGDFSKCKGGRINKPFVKVEDSSRHYCPVYLSMPNMPEFNLKSFPPCSPFYVEEKDYHGNRRQRHRGTRASVSEERAQGRTKKNRDKKRGGYCECCFLKYDNLITHLQGERHRSFSRSDEYLVVDRLVSVLHCNFIQVQTKLNRPKCSVSSVRIATRPCGKSNPRHKGHIDTPETFKEEQHQRVDEYGECYSGYPLKTKSVTDSPLKNQGMPDRKKVYLCSDQSKPLALKQPCRQHSLTSCTLKGELDLTPVPASSPGVVPVSDITHTDMNNSASHFCKVDVYNQSSSKSLNVKLEQQDLSRETRDVPLNEAVEEGSIFLEKMTDISEKERSLPTQSCCSVQQIKRRVRVYKRKRRKVDTCVISQEHSKPSDMSEAALEKVWQLFQSSDDTDVEFRGFED